MSSSNDHGPWDPHGGPQDGRQDPYGSDRQTWSPAGDGFPMASGPYGPGAAGPYGSGAAGPYGSGVPQPGPGGPAPAGAAPGVPGGQGQSRLLVGLMGIFFGGLGVHRFLMGYTTIGLVQVLVSVLSCFLLYPFVQIWGLVEGILVLARSESFQRDAHGRPLAD